MSRRYGARPRGFAAHHRSTPVSFLIAATVAASAACGVPPPEGAASAPGLGAAAPATAQATQCSYTNDELMLRVVNAFTELRESAGYAEWRTKRIGLYTWKAVSAPLTTNLVGLTLASPHPECAAALMDAFAARGYVTVDGSTAAVVDPVYGISDGTFGVFVNLSRGLTQSTSHTISVVLPPAISSRYLPSLSTSISIEAELTNPFTFLNTTYSEQRCTTCHDFGDAYHLPPNHPGGYDPALPHEFRACYNCHSLLTSIYQVPYDDELNQWRSPPFSLGIQWSAMTPLQRCQKTVERVQLQGLDVYSGITDHFHNDKRVRWAVEDGNPHDDTGFCRSQFDEDSVYGCYKAWPYSYQALDDMAADWAFYTLVMPDPCSNLLVDQYPVTKITSSQ